MTIRRRRREDWISWVLRSRAEGLIVVFRSITHVVEFQGIISDKRPLSSDNYVLAHSGLTAQ